MNQGRVSIEQPVLVIGGGFSGTLLAISLRQR
jgi:2-polyprenyl-6-methoxyphenol hydroxylase-like FAD-dependent oxidoreductase